MRSCAIFNIESLADFEIKWKKSVFYDKKIT